MKLTEGETCGVVGCSRVVVKVAAKNLKDVTEIYFKCKKPRTNENMAIALTNMHVPESHESTE